MHACDLTRIDGVGKGRGRSRAHHDKEPSNPESAAKGSVAIATKRKGTKWQSHPNSGERIACNTFTHSDGVEVPTKKLMYHLVVEVEAELMTERVTPKVQLRVL